MYEKRAHARMYLAHTQDDLNLRILRMLNGTFSLDVAHIFFCMIDIAYIIVLEARKTILSVCLVIKFNSNGSYYQPKAIW